MPPRTIETPRSSRHFAITGRSFDGHGDCCTLTIMRHLGWLSGLLLVTACSVDLVQNPDGSATGTGGQAGATATGIGGQAGTAATGSGGQAGTSFTGVGGEGGTRSTGGTSGGSAGRGGTFGHGGAAGHAADAGESCTQIETDYGNAMTAAAECTPGAAGQCQHLIDMSLSCPGCQRYVNDVTELDALAAMWNDQDCSASPHGPCPTIACVIPGPASCAAASGTPGGPNAGADPGGTCSSASLSNNAR
jgi:hypothetical protein